ncbi:MAG: hypothetical protein PHO97_05825, partial [Synergistaceae bacterium]|nr:hypothetical protein [Synergistaceae bacterium]
MEKISPGTYIGPGPFSIMGQVRLDHFSIFSFLLSETSFLISSLAFGSLLITPAPFTHPPEHVITS